MVVFSHLPSVLALQRRLESYTRDAARAVEERPFRAAFRTLTCRPSGPVAPLGLNPKFQAKVTRRLKRRSSTALPVSLLQPMKTNRRRKLFRFLFLRLVPNADFREAIPQRIARESQHTRGLALVPMSTPQLRGSSRPPTALTSCLREENWRETLQPCQFENQCECCRLHAGPAANADARSIMFCSSRHFPASDSPSASSKHPLRLPVIFLPESWAKRDRTNSPVREYLLCALAVGGYRWAQHSDGNKGPRERCRLRARPANRDWLPPLGAHPL